MLIGLESQCIFNLYHCKHCELPETVKSFIQGKFSHFVNFFSQILHNFLKGFIYSNCYAYTFLNYRSIQLS